MIIPLNIDSKNIYFKIFNTINKACERICDYTSKRRGRPPKYTNQQIIACLVYQVKNSIFSLRELEWKIRQDVVFQNIIGLVDIPDYSTLSIRANAIENSIYYGIYNMLITMIDSSFRVCAIDSTALRSSKYDSEAGYGKGTRLGSYKGYKLHLISTADDSIIPTAFEVTTANNYDNQVPNLLFEAKTFNPFILLGDAAYDDTVWFEKANSIQLNLLTDVNMRNASSIESFSDKNRYSNALFMESPIGEKLYKNRIKIEQLFSILKGLYNLENPRLYGKKRYERHISWVLFSYLIDEYNKKKQGIKSRKYPWNL